MNEFLQSNDNNYILTQLNPLINAKIFSAWGSIGFCLYKSFYSCKDDFFVIFSNLLFDYPILVFSSFYRNGLARYIMKFVLKKWKCIVTTFRFSIKCEKVVFVANLILIFVPIESMPRAKIFLTMWIFRFRNVGDDATVWWISTKNRSRQWLAEAGTYDSCI